MIEILRAEGIRSLGLNFIGLYGKSHHTNGERWLNVDTIVGSGRGAFTGRLRSARKNILFPLYHAKRAVCGGVGGIVFGNRRRATMEFKKRHPIGCLFVCELITRSAGWR